MMCRNGQITAVRKVLSADGGVLKGEFVRFVNAIFVYPTFIQPS